MNSAPINPNRGTTRRTLALPRWFLLLLSITLWPVLISLVHGLLPWALSGMARRIGWTNRNPGLWNWLGLIFVGLGAMVVLWFWLVHMRKVTTTKRLELRFTPHYLLTDGPYRFSRNPMYLAVLTIWLGWSIFYGSYLVLGTTFFFWLLMNFIMIPREERGLEARHTEAYRQYLKDVPRWF